MRRTVGRCGQCGGPVQVEADAMLIVGEWPPPTCALCGAIAEKSSGHIVMRMRKGQPIRFPNQRPAPSDVQGDIHGS